VDKETLGRVPGLFKGVFTLASDFEAPLPDF
jgi:hypothetical protein